MAKKQYKRGASKNRKIKGSGKMGKSAAKMLLGVSKKGKKMNRLVVRAGGGIGGNEVVKKVKVNPVVRKQEEKRKKVSVKGTLYPEGHSILLVGEGDFSFAASLVRLRGHGDGIVATSLDQLDQIKRKYAHSDKHIQTCVENGVVLVHGVNCTELEDNQSISGIFDRVVFNFPHSGCGLKDKAKNVALHKKLVTDFLTSAQEIIRPETGEIHIALKKGEPYDSWQIPRLVTECGLVVKTAYPFNPHMFPGYAHCKTSGTGGEPGDNSTITKNGARIWVISYPKTEDASGINQKPEPDGFHGDRSY
eukprot:TRINITY_DN25025_c0_g1_i1.p1 TRINITY_DN25025_c0_g1~~TRINITY_DN25025_c0_g1_i1.p1  ORF type:complete len:326 (+),score=60.90 TRINITY_DN25025_c0_g1_i1:66-980(+)